MSKCRAKNPGSCRVHGSNDAMSVLLSDKVALRNVQESQKALDNADSMENYFEAQQSLSHDKKAYDATLKGMEELTDDLKGHYGVVLNNEERMDRKMRLAEAKAYRKEVLSKDPAYQETMAKYESFVKENGVEKHTLEKENLHETLGKLSEIPYGTPIALKTENGVIYTHAGDGYNERPKNKFSKKFSELMTGKASFVRHYDGDKRYNAVVFHIKSSTNLVYAKEFQEVTVLKADAYKNGFDQFVNSHADKKAATETPHKENSRWSIKGKDYYYEVEGSNKVERATWETGKNDWSVGRRSQQLTSDPLEIREIHS